MLDWVTRTLESGGYLAVAGLMFLENVFPPIPSELIMPFAGFTAGQGKLSFWGVVLAGMIGSLLGQLPLYYLGKFVGEERLKAWADKHGKWLTLSGEDIQKAKEWFERHGTKAAFFGRLVPGVRSLVSLPAGFSSMPLIPFLLYSAAGTGLWAGILAYLGRLLGKNYKAVQGWLEPATYVILGLMVLSFVVVIVKRKRAEKGGEAPA